MQLTTRYIYKPIIELIQLQRKYEFIQRHAQKIARWVVGIDPFVSNSDHHTRPSVHVSAMVLLFHEHTNATKPSRKISMSPTVSIPSHVLPPPHGFRTSATENFNSTSTKIGKLGPAPTATGSCHLRRPQRPRAPLQDHYTARWAKIVLTVANRSENRRKLVLHNRAENQGKFCQTTIHAVPPVHPRRSTTSLRV